MRSIAVISVYLFFSFHATAQNLADENVAFETFLVKLAWKNHPTAAVYNSKLKIADLGIKQAKLGYLDAALPFLSYSNVSTPFNGSVTDGFSGGGGFAFGVSFRIAPLYLTEHNVAIAEENKKIAKLEKADGKLEIQTKVLTLYQQYISAQRVVEERLKMESEARENQKLVLTLFKKDAAEYEDVNAVSGSYYKATEDRVRAETEVILAKIALEEWIGVNLEEAREQFGGEE
ncbi:MAG: TolC family protein [Bacteroidota bacterium]